MKRFLLHQMRRRALQPLWDWLAHTARIGQNYWATQPSESGELRVLEHLRPAVTFDVGANVGDYAREASKFGLVYAFEPSSSAFAVLARVPGVKAFNFALGSECGAAVLHAPKRGSTIASLIETRHAIRPFDRSADETVKVTTLDIFCEAEGVGRIDLLKVDVEGAELAVLRGAARMMREGRIGNIQFEFGDGHLDARTYLRDFYDLLEGWAFYRIVSDGLWAVDYSPELETFAPINYLATRP